MVTPCFYLLLSNTTSEGKTAFYIRKGHTHSNIFSDNNVQPATIVQSCYLENSFVKDEINDELAIVTELPDTIPNIWHVNFTVGENEEGLWEVLYINCKESLVTFNLTITQINPGNNYLSAGDSPLPLVYGLSAFAYFGIVVYWVNLLRHKDYNKVTRAHWLMLVLLIMLFINKFLQSANYHYMKIGYLSSGWTLGLYAFGIIKGFLGIIIILLLTSGWMFIKPFLSSRDICIIYISVILQIIIAISSFIVALAPMGSYYWLLYNSLLPIIDLASCLIILWTILQTRKSLSAGISADGKENDMHTKYKLWSSFYVVTLIYMYITRVIVQLLHAALPFQYVTWFGEAVNEIATLLFCIYIGSKFRPYPNNPYMQLSTDDMDYEELDNDHAISNNGSVRLKSFTRMD
ncbi:unnamed protein product [Cunninghamella blakesleeana]